MAYSSSQYQSIPVILMSPRQLFCSTTCPLAPGNLSLSPPSPNFGYLIRREGRPPKERRWVLSPMGCCLEQLRKTSAACDYSAFLWGVCSFWFRSAAQSRVWSRGATLRLPLPKREPVRLAYSMPPGRQHRLQGGFFRQFKCKDSGGNGRQL